MNSSHLKEYFIHLVVYVQAIGGNQIKTLNKSSPGLCYQFFELVPLRSTRSEASYCKNT
jgi:hypothetical protein